MSGLETSLFGECSKGISPLREFCFFCFTGSRACAPPSAPGLSFALRRDGLRAQHAVGSRRRSNRACFRMNQRCRPNRANPRHWNPVVVRFALSPGVSDPPARRWTQRSREASVDPRATILIVDDEPGVREVLEEYFTTHGYAA